MPTTVESAYSIIFIAKLREGVVRSDALKALHTTFKLNKPQIQTLLQKTPAPFKQNLTKDQADRVVKALWKAGWHCELQKSGKTVFSTQKKALKETSSTPLVPAHPTIAESKTTSTQQPLPSASREATNKKPHLRTVATSSKGKLQRIKSDTAPCTICIPDKWEPMSYLNPNACLQAGSGQSESYLIVIEQKKALLGGAMPLEQYAIAVTNTAAKGIQNGEVLMAPQFKLNEKSLLKYAVSEMRGFVTTTEVHYFISVYESNTSFFTAYLWCSEKTFPKRKNLFTLLASSFLLTK